MYILSNSSLDRNKIDRYVCTTNQVHGLCNARACMLKSDRACLIERPVHGTVCALVQYIVLYTCFEFEGKKQLLFYEGFNECMYETFGVQYIQQG